MYEQMQNMAIPCISDNRVLKQEIFLQEQPTPAKDLGFIKSTETRRMPLQTDMLPLCQVTDKIMLRLTTRGGIDCHRKYSSDINVFNRLDYFTKTRNVKH